MVDNYSLWESHQAREDAWRARQPKCCRCGEHILDEDLWDINGDLYCEKCAEREFKRKTEVYED